MRRKATPLLKFLIILVVAGIAFFVFTHLSSIPVLKGMLKKNTHIEEIDRTPHHRQEVANTNATTPIASQPEDRQNDHQIIRVGICTWGGYAGGPMYNGQFDESMTSKFFTNYGILVKFIVIDDPITLQEAFKADKIDLMWTTADVFPIIADSLRSYNPVAVFQSDWSKGGDVIVASQRIKSVNDLVNNNVKIAVATKSPSQTLLINTIEAAGHSYKDLNIAEAPSAPDAAAYFKNNQVDVAVVWSPDDSDCLANVPGSKVLASTQDASQIIPDIFISKKSFVNTHLDAMIHLAEGWMLGVDEILASETGKTTAAKILARGYNQPFQFMLNAINKVQLATYKDQLNFFNLSGTYKGVTGESVYRKMKSEYQNLGYCSLRTPNWRDVVDLRVINGINASLFANSVEHNKVTFTKLTPAQTENVKVISTKHVIINFATNQYTLSPDAMYTIDREFSSTAKVFANSRIRIEGFTDNVGNYNSNILLSQRRAQAVANYLVKRYGFDPNRFIVVGNGPNNPIADNNTADGRAKNRRTDFQIVAQ